MQYEYEIKQLSKAFYDDCHKNSWNEVLEKEKRSYNCIVIETYYDFFICIPFRTEMNHKNGYHFKNSIRSKTHKSGIDYSKMVLIDNSDYISDSAGIIDPDEYKEFVQNEEKIISDSVNYLKDYIDFSNGESKLSAEANKRKFGYTSLCHFTDLLKKYHLINK